MTPQQEAAALRNFALAYDRYGDAGSCPGNCSGMEEGTGAPSSLAVCYPKRLRADEGGIVNRPPSSLTMLLSRHTKRREWLERSG